MQIGDTIPDFKLPATGKGEISSSDLMGNWTVLYFYPKDLTPGCTTQAINFSERLADIKALGAQVIGVSKDPVKRHDKFIEKHDLKFPLIADEDGILCEAFDCWVEKQMYGKTYMGIERSTFLISPDGNVSEIWRKVKVKTHVEEVLDALHVVTKRAD